MPVVFGKPGSIRYRGKMRAQMQKSIVELRALNAYNTKLSNRVPPIPFMTAAQSLQVANMVLQLQAWLDTKN